MIRRISRNNDLKDLIKSCPSGVIDDIYKIEYYIQGYNTLIECSFTKVGNQLVVILPTSLLETLPNGILMRRAYYKVTDSSYPDGYYNLEFEDCMNIWLGENESEEPVIPEYVTEDELAETLSSYATQEWVSDQGFVTASTMPSDIATQEWVQGQGYLTSVALSGYATTQQLEDLSSSVQSSLSSYATQSWVGEQGYITSSALSGYATQDWVQEQGYLTEHQDLSSYATMSWVENQGYITSSALSGYATETWVSQQGFASETDLSSLASRVSDLETNYGDAITISNNILS